MPAKKTAAKKAARKSPAVRTTLDANETRRFWLSYPVKLVKRPVIWEMAHKFPVVFNVRQASVSEEIGILCLELEGKRSDLKAVIAWLEKVGVKVEPVEINVIES
jgi:ABC-type methionine transport system ATPase subunit